MENNENQINQEETLQNASLDKNLQKIEDFRQLLNSKYKVHNSLKIVITVVAMLIIAFAFIALPNMMENNTFLTIIISVLALAMVLIYSFVVKKYMEKQTKEYLNVYYQAMNDYILDEKLFSNVEMQNPRTIEKAQFDANLMYKDTIQVGSRGYTSFTYKGQKSFVCDAASQYQDTKHLKVSFAGKYLTSTCKYDGSPIFIYLKGDDRTLPPTNVDDYKVVYNEDDIIIRSNNDQWNKVVNKKVMDLIQNIRVGKYLVDVNIAIHSETVYVCMGYDDSLMVLPLQLPVKEAPYSAYKKDLIKALDLIEELK